MEEKYRKVEALNNRIRKQSVEPAEVEEYLTATGSNPLKQKVKLSTVLLRPQVSLKGLIETLPDLKSFVEETGAGTEEIEESEIILKYQTYIEKEKQNALRLAKFDDIHLPENIDFMKIKAISYEGREKLQKIRPQTIGQASRISGVSPADISILLIWLDKQKSLSN